MNDKEIKIMIEKLMEVYKEQGREFKKEYIENMVNYLKNLDKEREEKERE